MINVQMYVSSRVPDEYRFEAIIKEMKLYPIEGMEIRVNREKYHIEKAIFDVDTDTYLIELDNGMRRM